ncbi:MAG: hypothetical protein K8J08_22420 [Thermoanaerobaculia bacterium]|nr:hypothetical protein [Thermoanaerobaculia bacterium]
MVAVYGLSIGLSVRPRTVLVEGTTDAEAFALAARLEYEATGTTLLGEDFTILAAGEGERGGTSGVIRELIAFRGLARACLLPSGKPRYRFVGLFDNDSAGRRAVKSIREIDSSVLEFKDVFRLHPVMPAEANLDPQAMTKAFERANLQFKGLEWELEDLYPDQLLNAFQSENPTAVARQSEIGGKVHRDFTRDGKARLHRFAKLHAMRCDLEGIVQVLRALRFLVGLK